MKKLVLVTDDSESMRKVLVFHLRNSGYDTVEAADGLAGLKAARERKFDLIITDKNMPHLDGLGLLRAVRGLSQYATTPILMLTTEASEDVKAQGRAAGATGWLVKPFQPDRLMEVIRRLIGAP